MDTSYTVTTLNALKALWKPIAFFLFMVADGAILLAAADRLDGTLGTVLTVLGTVDLVGAGLLALALMLATVLLVALQRGWTE